MVELTFAHGLTLGLWWELLRRERFHVDPACYRRAFAITCSALINSGLACLEGFVWQRRVDRVGPVPAPLFLLGHFRHGTTHLHELLAADPRRSFPSTWEVTAPSHFLLSERMATPLVDRLLPPTRPQDAVEIGCARPQEDEYALALTSLCSPYFVFLFPRSDAHWARYLRLTEVPPAERERWKAALVRVVRRHAAREARPLVLKSPAHTARVHLLLELFPEARFVHIHRHPYEVFASTRHLVQTASATTVLQRTDTIDSDDRILRWYTTLYDGWFAGRACIPPGRLHELGFADLQRDPFHSLQTLYAALDLGDFEPARPAVERHLANVRDHPRNRYPPLTDEERARVRTAWARSFDEWGYD